MNILGIARNRHAIPVILSTDKENEYPKYTTLAVISNNNK